MELRDRAVALYGRFSQGQRDRLQREIVRAGGTVARDLTRRTDILVVGGLAAALVDTGALSARLAEARSRGVPVMGERSVAAAMSGKAREPATLPLPTALSDMALTRQDTEVLAAFDLVRLEGDCCRFADASVIRAAAELVCAGRSLGETVRILARARDLAPRGRHKIVLTAAGGAALQWTDGLTSLEGQGLLPLDEVNATLEDLFEAAALVRRMAIWTRPHGSMTSAPAPIAVTPSRPTISGTYGSPRAATTRPRSPTSGRWRATRASSRPVTTSLRRWRRTVSWTPPPSSLTRCWMLNPAIPTLCSTWRSSR